MHVYSYSEAMILISTRKGYKLIQLCKDAKLSRGYDRKIEDPNWNPKLRTLSKLCNVLEIDIASFCLFANTGDYGKSYAVHYAYPLDFVYTSRHLAFALKTLIKVQNKTQYELNKGMQTDFRNCLMLAKNRPDNQITISSAEMYAEAFGITLYALLTWLQHTAVITYHFAKDNNIEIKEDVDCESYTD